jgi:cyclopropane fatty-acyl-phospholipid synthase-like methyltransferase
MERGAWLKQMREKTEALYDHLSPLYWEKYGSWVSETHVRYLLKFLSRMAPRSHLLSAGCGAGLYDGILLEAGHSVVGIDLSTGMLARARERFPNIRYEKKGLQEMDFQDEFDGAICIDALEHVSPEDWPVIIRGFQEALKPGGVLYFTLDVSTTDDLEEDYEKAKSQGLPVVYGEVVAEVDEAFEKVMAMDSRDDPAELADKAVYHYYPSVAQVRKWLDQENFAIEAEEMGILWYKHFLVRKRKGI